MLLKAIPNPQAHQDSLLDTSLNSREKRSTSTHQNINASSPNQEILASPWSSPTHRKQTPQLTGNTTFHPAERAPQHINLNKMKKQRNTQQMKKHDKIPPNQMKEEIGSLSEKESRIMTVKMIQNFGNKMELQINRLETRIEKMQEMFNRDLSEIKKGQSIKNNAIT